MTEITLPCMVPETLRIFHFHCYAEFQDDHKKGRKKIFWKNGCLYRYCLVLLKIILFRTVSEILRIFFIMIFIVKKACNV